MVRTSACHAEGREFESRRSRHRLDATCGVLFYLYGNQMKNISAILLLTMYQVLSELIYLITYPIIVPILRSKGYIAAIRPKAPDSQGGILVHCASVGEINALKALVRQILDKYPEKQIHITTTTLTGLKIASQIDSRIRADLAVLDVYHLRQRQLKMINPSLILIMETEIWPNMLAWAAGKQVPVVFLNARMTDKTHIRYMRFSRLVRYLGRAIKEINCQTEDDKARFEDVFGIKAEYSGNLKYALNLTDYDRMTVRKQWGYLDSDLVICFGSSRPGEERLILQVFQELNRQYRGLKLIIAIRHPKRIKEVSELLSSMEYSLHSSGEEIKPIHIIDVLGHLNEAYAVCDLAIVGGSFYDFGGHNPLEPSYYSRAIIMGQYHNSCRDSVRQLSIRGGIKISKASKLETDVKYLLDDPQMRSQMGLAAKSVLEENSKSLDKHLDSIGRWIG